MLRHHFLLFGYHTSLQDHFSKLSVTFILYSNTFCWSIFCTHCCSCSGCLVDWPRRVQEYEQEAHSMRQQLRQQGEAVCALKDELATSQQEQQQSAEVSLLHIQPLVSSESSPVIVLHFC